MNKKVILSIIALLSIPFATTACNYASSSNQLSNLEKFIAAENLPLKKEFTAQQNVSTTGNLLYSFESPFSSTITSDYWNDVDLGYKAVVDPVVAKQAKEFVDKVIVTIVWTWSQQYKALNDADKAQSTIVNMYKQGDYNRIERAVKTSLRLNGTIFNNKILGSQMILMKEKLADFWTRQLKAPGLTPAESTKKAEEAKLIAEEEFLLAYKEIAAMTQRQLNPTQLDYLRTIQDTKIKLFVAEIAPTICQETLSAHTDLAALKIACDTCISREETKYKNLVREQTTDSVSTGATSIYLESRSLTLFGIHLKTIANDFAASPDAEFENSLYQAQMFKAILSHIERMGDSHFKNLVEFYVVPNTKYILKQVEKIKSDGAPSVVPMLDTLEDIQSYLSN